MQSVFNTKDDDVGGGVNGVRLIVDDGKVIFRNTKSDDSDGTASWIAEITTISSAEDDDAAASLSEEVGDGIARPDTGNGLPVDHGPHSGVLMSEPDSETHDDGNVWPAIVHQDTRCMPRMSLRQKTSPPQKTSPTESRRRTPPKMICARGRGGRLIRTFGCRATASSLRLWSTERKNGALPSDGVGKYGSKHMQVSTAKQEFQRLMNNSAHSVVSDALDKPNCSDSGIDVFNFDNVGGREPVSNVPAIDRDSPLVDHSCNGETEPTNLKNGSSSVGNSPKKSSIFDSTSKELFYKRRKVSFSKESQTNTVSDFGSISSSSCTDAKWPVSNDNNRKFSSSRNRRKRVSANGVMPHSIPRPILPKPVPRRNHSSKEIEDLIEGSIKVAKIVDSTHQKVVSLSNPSAPSRPPVVVIKAVGGKYSSQTLSAAATAAANPNRTLKCLALPEANTNTNCNQTVVVPGTDSRIVRLAQVMPAKNSLQLSPLFRDVPLLLVKTVNSCAKNVSQSNGSSKMAARPLETFKVLSSESGMTVKMMARCDDNLKLICDQAIPNGSARLLKAVEKHEDSICAPPVAPSCLPVADEDEKANVSKIVTQTTNNFNDMLSMPRATKCKAIQKISAIVSAKRKPSVACRKRPSETHSKGNELESANLPAPDINLPPPPRLIPCSMSRTEELQRKNLQDKLLTSNLTIHPNLQCRVNIPLLKRHPLVPRLDRVISASPSPPHLLPVSTAVSAETESAKPSSLEIDKRPQARTRSTHRTTITSKARFSRNGRRIGRPPIRSLADSGRDASASESDFNSPTSIVNQELKRLRLLPPTFNDWELPGSSRTRPSYPSYADQPLRSSIRQTECAFRYREISLRKHDNFTQIVLTSSTRVKNGLNVQVLRELKMALDAARTDTNCHVVLLNGTGSVFCSGIDLISLVKDGENAFFAKEMATAMREFSKAVMSFPKTLVAAVNGAAVGLGVTMLPLFDLVYASDKATFYTPYTKLGQIPEGGATYSLPFCMGFARGACISVVWYRWRSSDGKFEQLIQEANGLLMCSRRITATEAFECGLVTQVLWPSAFMEGVIPQVQALAKQSHQTVGSAKALIRYHSARQLEVTLDIECRILSEQWASRECIQSIREFLDKEEVV